MITREEIDKKQFSTTRVREGYVQDEVDGFLDQVGVDFEYLEKANRKYEDDNIHLRNEITRLRDVTSTAAIPTVSPPRTASAERVLTLAEETAQRYIAEASAEADKIRSEANAEAGQVRAAAKAEAAGITSSAAAEAAGIANHAEAERQRILNELETSRSELFEQIEQLKSKRANYKTWLRAALNKIEQEEIDA